MVRMLLEAQVLPLEPVVDQVAVQQAKLQALLLVDQERQDKVIQEVLIFLLQIIQGVAEVAHLMRGEMGLHLQVVLGVQALQILFLALP